MGIFAKMNFPEKKNRWTDRQTNGGQTDGQTDRQTNADFIEPSVGRGSNKDFTSFQEQPFRELSTNFIIRNDKIGNASFNQK